MAQFDVIIVGGGYAGVSAALQLAGTRRKIAVIDEAVPRNAAVGEARGIFGQDGKAPADIMAEARAQLHRYESAEWLARKALRVEKADDGFLVHLDDGAKLTARRLILANGVSDVLPQLPGLGERWKKSVFHCPYCNGHDAGGGPIGVVATGPASFALAMLVRDWGRTTLFTNDALQLEPEQMQRLALRDVHVEPVTVQEVVDKASLRLADGRTVKLDAIFINTQTSMTDRLAEQLGCALGEGASGPIVQTDHQCETSIPGVFACGDIMRSSGKIALSIGDGTIAGIAAHQSLIFR